MHIHNHRNFNPIKFIPWIILGIIGAAALALVFGFVVMALWNWLMPEIFGLSHIGYWQAWGLVLLAHILFKGHIGHHHDRHSDRLSNRDEWKEKFRERFSHPTSHWENRDDDAPTDKSKGDDDAE